MRFTAVHRALRILHRQEKRTWSICFGNEVNAAAMDALRQRYREAGLAPPSYTAMVVKAIALGIDSLRGRFPELNSTFCGLPGFRWIHVFDDLSAGVAISRDGAEDQDLVYFSVYQSPQRQRLSDMSRQLRDEATRPVQEVATLREAERVLTLPPLVQNLILGLGAMIPRARQRFRGTFALTSVGKFGVDYQFTLPQTACLHFGFGSIRERPVVADGRVTVARTFCLTVSFDRRLMNGRPPAALMGRIREILETAAFEEDMPEAAAEADQGQTPAKQATAPEHRERQRA